MHWQRLQAALRAVTHATAAAAAVAAAAAAAAAVAAAEAAAAKAAAAEAAAASVLLFTGRQQDAPNRCGKVIGDASTSTRFPLQVGIRSLIIYLITLTTGGSGCVCTAALI